MEDARTAHEALGPEGSGPGAFRSTADPKSPEYITAKQQHDAAQAAHLDEQQRRERISKDWADQLDTTFTKSSGEIHGEPPPPPPPNGYQGGHGGVLAPGAPAAAQAEAVASPPVAVGGLRMAVVSTAIPAVAAARRRPPR